MNWTRLYGKLHASMNILKGKVQPSFSQAGEDQVIRYLMNDCLKILNPTYLEIGTNHPYLGNNTFYFYNRGSKGVCVEPDPRYAGLIKQYRKRDVLLEAGIGTGGASRADFYVFPKKYSGWNTFSKVEAKNREVQSGIKPDKVMQVDLADINETMQQYFSPHPNILSIDVEGLDLDILKSIHFNRFRPEVICVESITFSVTNEQQKILPIVDFVTSQGYFVFGDTYVNTIFCDAGSFKKIAT